MNKLEVAILFSLWIGFLLGVLLCTFLYGRQLRKINKEVENLKLK